MTMTTSLDSSGIIVAPNQVQDLLLACTCVKSVSSAPAELQPAIIEPSCAVCNGSCVIIPSAGNSSLSD